MLQILAGCFLVLMFTNVAFAASPGTMCSLALSGHIDCIGSEHFAYDLCLRLKAPAATKG